MTGHSKCPYCGSGVRTPNIVEYECGTIISPDDEGAMQNSYCVVMQKGYDRAIADVVAWLRREKQQTTTMLEDWRDNGGKLTIMEAVANAIERGEAKGASR